MPCIALSPNSDRFQPPKLWKAIGTGMGTLIPTMPMLQLVVKCRDISPSDV